MKNKSNTVMDAMEWFMEGTAGAGDTSTYPNEWNGNIGLFVIMLSITRTIVRG